MCQKPTPATLASIQYSFKNSKQQKIYSEKVCLLDRLSLAAW